MVDEDLPEEEMMLAAAGNDEDESDEDDDESDDDDEDDDEDDDDDESDNDESDDDVDSDDDDDDDDDESDKVGKAGKSVVEDDEGDDDVAEDDGEIAAFNDADVFGSAADYEDAVKDDFEDDDGSWTDGDYEEAADHIFGLEDYFGEAADERYLDMGWEPVEDTETRRYRSVIERVVPGVSHTARFWNDGDAVMAQGFLPVAALREAREKLPGVDFTHVHATIVRTKSKMGPSSPEKLPPALDDVVVKDVVDLRKYCSPVADQKDTGRNSAFAWTHALEFALSRTGKKSESLAASYTMWQMQGVQGDRGNFALAASGGDATQDGPEVAMPLVKRGCCRAELWPTDRAKPRGNLKKLAEDARSQRLRASLVPIELPAVKRVLSSGNPVHLTMDAGVAFQSVARDGLFKSTEKPTGKHGGHAMLIVGYKGNHFIVKSSWGEEWGDNGYCYIPKKVLRAASPTFVAVLIKEPK